MRQEKEVTVSRVAFSSDDRATIQIMRGLSIILVLIRHAIAQVNTTAILSGIESIIICFHMPVFFVIAGYLFQLNIVKYTSIHKLEFIGSKAKHLMLPYAFWTILLWGGVQIAHLTCPKISAVLNSIGFSTMRATQLVYGLLTYEKYYTEHLWFLYVLFVFFVINIYISKKGSEAKVLLISFLVGMMTRYVELPHIIERSMTWSIFFFFGRYLAKNRKMMDTINRIKRKKSFITTTIVFILISALRLFLIHIHFNGTIQLVLKYAVGIAGVWVLYGLAQHITFNRIKRIIKSVGDYSYDIYLMHNPYFDALGAIVLSKIIGINVYITVLVATSVGVVLPMMTSKFVIRNNTLVSKIMIGK